jgi:hypothetical protein
MTDKYILIGQTPVPEPNLLTWAYWFETADRIVAKTEVGASLVSTVFLGLDHRFRGDGPPLLFETMVFGGGECDGDMWRCSTWLEAEAQHAEVVRELTTRLCSPGRTKEN